MSHIEQLLQDIQNSLYEEAKAFRDANIKDVDSYEAFKAAISEGFWARGPWKGEAHNLSASHLQCSLDIVRCSRDLEFASYH